MNNIFKVNLKSINDNGLFFDYIVKNKNAKIIYKNKILSLENTLLKTNKSKIKIYIYLN